MARNHWRKQMKSGGTVIRGCFVMILSLTLAPFTAYGGVPHTAYGVLQYTDGSHPSSLNFSAYITVRTGEVLDVSSAGCGYSPAEGQWFVQCGNFVTAWSVGNVLRVTFNDGSGFSGSMDVTLTNEPADDAGVTTLTTGATYAKLSVDDVAIPRGSNLDLSVFMEGVGVSDSVVAYELKLGFDPDVLLAVGVETVGTMTQNWDMTISAPKETDVHIGGFSTNQPSSRLIPDAGILVKVKFLVHGLPTSQTSNSTLVRFLEGTVFTLTEEIRIAHSKTGAVSVLNGTSPTTRNIDLYPNWNLISLGIVPDPNTLPDVFDDHQVEYVFGYRSGEGPMSWDVNRPSFLNDLEYLDGLHGYWIKSGDAVKESWSVEGDGIPVDTPIPLYSGWNLKGYLPGVADSISHAFQTLDTSYAYIFSYEGGASGGPKSWDRQRPWFLNDLGKLDPGAGYWVKMTDAMSLVYPTGGYLPKRIHPLLPVDAGQDTAPIVTPWICDFWEASTLVLMEGDTVDVYDSDGVWCGRTTVQEENGILGFSVHVFGDDLSTTPTIDEGAVEGDTLSFFVNGLPALVVQGSNVWNWNSSKEIKLQLGSTDVSDSRNNSPSDIKIALGNYPNPFNAYTIISFILDTPGAVSLVVYDALGRQLIRLLDQVNHRAGEYKLAWDGCDHLGQRVASGLYFFRLNVGDNVKTHKMLLLY